MIRSYLLIALVAVSVAVIPGAPRRRPATQVCPRTRSPAPTVGGLHRPNVAKPLSHRHRHRLFRTIAQQPGASEFAWPASPKSGSKSLQHPGGHDRPGGDGPRRKAIHQHHDHADRQPLPEFVQYVSDRQHRLQLSDVGASATAAAGRQSATAASKPRHRSPRSGIGGSVVLFRIRRDRISSIRPDIRRPSCTRVITTLTRTRTVSGSNSGVAW